MWLVKADIRKPLEYGTILALLLFYRIMSWLLPQIKKRRGSSLVSGAEVPIK